MAQNSLQKLSANAAEKSLKYPKLDINFSYGTAGFRFKADCLHSVMYRVGILAVLRSRNCGSKTIGIMITASHNPVDDNGVKMIDPMGEMLAPDWEKFATDLANSVDVGQCLSDIIAQVKGTSGWHDVGNVVIARDTRPSGESLAQAVLDGIQAVGGQHSDLGLLTTPQLHYIVRCINDPKYGCATEKGYYEKISTAFMNLVKPGTASLPTIHVDGANGVGAIKLHHASFYLKEVLPLSIFNDGSSGQLNLNCGADFVKGKQKGPEGVQIHPGKTYLSFDGDADRIVFFYHDSQGEFHLLDGDKISTLIVAFLKEKLEASGLNLDIGLGVVQTAYANGSSTNYLEDVLKVPVVCAKTGVKHLHKKAQDFDIGVYFESNGHGTVLFSSNFKMKLSEALHNEGLTDEQVVALKELESVVNIINETVGDAISDMLLVQAILHKKQWDLPTWDKCYKDLPNRQRKVQVKDRRLVTTTDAERKATSPKGLQEEIDKLVKQVKKGRSFARPSGTEDIVRVYAEAETQKEADSLAFAVSQKVFDLAGGIGENHF